VSERIVRNSIISQSGLFAFIQLEEILPALWAGERKYFAKENMEPNVSVRTYISLLNGLAALEITDSAEEKREKVQAEKEAEAKTTKQNDEDEKKDEKTNEADTKEADAKEEQKKTTTTDNMDSKAGFLRTPSTMLGFRWKDLASSQDNIYRHVSLHHERAAVMMALGICVSNIAVTESKAVTVDGVTDAAKTALCAAGLFKAAEEAVSAETVAVSPSEDMKGGIFLRALRTYNLAIAQENLVQRCILQGQEAGLIASLCVDASAQYQKTLTELSALPTSSGSTSKQISSYARIKVKYLQALALFFQGQKRMAEKDQKGCVSAIKCFGQAVTLLNEAKSEAKTQASDKCNKGDTVLAGVSADLASNLTVLNQKLQAANRDNDQVYHSPIPEDNEAMPTGRSLVEGKETPWSAEPVPAHATFADTRLASLIKPIQAKAVPGIANEEDSDDKCVLL
jgi:hypothetical protein